MKHSFFLMLISVAIGISSATAKNIFVSTNGKNTNNGSLQKPYATLAYAIFKARGLKESTTIYLRGGNYVVSHTINLNNLDSRDENAQLKICNYQNETVTITSGKVLHLKWEDKRNGRYAAKVDDTKMVFDQLFCNDQPLVMARYPNYHSEILPYGGSAADAIVTKRTAQWENPTGAFVHGLHSARWGDMAYLVAGKKDNGELVLKGGYQNNRPSAMHARYRFVENVKEELDTLNEWYFDKDERTLYGMFGKKNPNQMRFTAPQLETLIHIEGDKAAVANITISGINFSQTLRTFMKTQEPLLRSDWCIYRGAAVFLCNTTNVNLQNCTLTNLGGNAIFLSGHNYKVSIAGNLISEIGASGIAVVGMAKAVRSPLFRYGEFQNIKDIDKKPGPKSDDYPVDCIISNNLIHDIGLVEKQTAGVQLSMCKRIKVTHNTIYDVPRSGINCNEGTWGGHYIAFNDVFNAVKETGDHGAFNSWGRDRFWHPNREKMDSIIAKNPMLYKLDAVEPTVLFNNRFRCDNGWDIDLDDGSSNYIIANNILLSGGLKLREGFDRVVKNNILINNGFHPHVWFANSNDQFMRNIVGVAHQPIRVNNWGNIVDFNIFQDSLSLKQSRLNGTDVHSVWENSAFVNDKNGFFQIKPASKAWALGFKNIDTTFGIISSRLKQLAKRVDIPTLRNINIANDGITDFFKLKVKNLLTLAEQSATGMNEIKGVLVVESNRLSKLYPQVKSNDVILAFDEKPVSNLQDLMATSFGIQHKERTTMAIFRDQRLQKIEVNLK